MQVILQEDVPHVGKAGEVIEVSQGFGRNFLLPQKKAVVADPGNLKMLEHHQRVVTAKQAKLKAEMEVLATKLTQTRITLARTAGEEGKLFGSVTVKDIAEALQHAGFTLDRRSITLLEPIRHVGEFSVVITLQAGVTTTVKIWVTEQPKT